MTLELRINTLYSKYSIQFVAVTLVSIFEQYLAEKNYILKQLKKLYTNIKYL